MTVRIRNSPDIYSGYPFLLCPPPPPHYGFYHLMVKGSIITPLSYTSTTAAIPTLIIVIVIVVLSIHFIIIIILIIPLIPEHCYLDHHYALKSSPTITISEAVRVHVHQTKPPSTLSVHGCSNTIASTQSFRSVCPAAADYRSPTGLCPSGQSLDC
ncbi:hypothetical protein PoB_002520500 [Plakobranchus ocellatus]|uniref:Uncharacterized protein n=1 Tax=Plakobranchus ocellatus TaxID=259542 RepID=A0AAV3ZU78_9GAST|nr:hypothetical protein PoB_002520500 [Plakobranchus ocellatus]